VHADKKHVFLDMQGAFKTGQKLALRAVKNGLKNQPEKERKIRAKNA